MPINFKNKTDFFVFFSIDECGKERRELGAHARFAHRFSRFFVLKKREAVDSLKATNVSVTTSSNKSRENNVDFNFCGNPFSIKGHCASRKIFFP